MDKTAIKNFAVRARSILISAVKQRAFEYGITQNGENDADLKKIGSRPFTPTEQEQRKQLIHRIRMNGFIQTMEEAAFTWFNRLIALRFMEVNGYLPSRTRVFSDENGAFRPEILSDALSVEIDGLNREYVLELLEKQDNDLLYKYLLITQCNALNQCLPEIFEEISGWTELVFPNNLLRNDSVIAHMVEDIPEQDWTEQVQIVGWLYQYYNTEPKNRIFSDLKKNIKVSAGNIPAATQLFTPDWIVRYMVDNSLGRLWLEGYSDSTFKNHLKYYLDDAEQEAEVQKQLDHCCFAYQSITPEKIKFIDPCMGSGHILVYAFDVLMQIYTSCGWSERDAAKSIITNNLYGLDIDRRAYQLAYFAVMMKARQYNRRILQSGIVPNLANFQDTDGVNEEMLCEPMKAFVKQFAFADTYGSLMEVTPPEGIDVAEISGNYTSQLNMMLKISSILSQKYDVVVTNPPYMGSSNMNATLRDFVRMKFPDSKSDLFACFIERCTTLTKPHGYYAMITQHSWMFLLRFEKLRNKLIHRRFINMLHLGSCAFDQGDVGTIVQAVSFVMKNQLVEACNGKYHKLIQYHDTYVKEDAFLKKKNEHIFLQQNFKKIPHNPIVYWVSGDVTSLFGEQTISDIAEVKQGMTTSDNKRFLKRWFEVGVNHVCFHASDSMEAKKSEKRWFPYNKGGGYRKWYGNHEYVVNYYNDGSELKAFHDVLNQKSAGGRIKNKEFYFKSSITWTFIAINPGFRYCPEGFIFDVAGSSLFLNENLLFYVLGFMCSSAAKYLLEILNPTMNIQTNDVNSLPLIIQTNDRKVDMLVQENIQLSKADWDSFETSWDFKRHPLI